MRNEREIKQELDELGASFLSDHKKEKEVFQPPVQYFDELPARVQNHISARKKMLWNLPIFVRWSPAFALVIALLVTAYIGMQKNASVQNIKTVAEVKTELADNAEITETDILLDELDEDIILEAFASAETAPVSKEKIKMQQVQPAENEDIEEYIIENFDEYLLIEEL